MYISVPFLPILLLQLVMSMDVTFDSYGSEADDATSWSPSDTRRVGSSSPFPQLGDLDEWSIAEESFAEFTSEDDEPMPLMNYWKSSKYVCHNITSSFDAWCARYNFDPYRQDVPTEPQFLSLLNSPFIHIDSSAIVLATFYEYSSPTQAKLLHAAQYGKVEYDHMDIVAALSIPWYDAFFLSCLLDKYPVCTEEMLWYIIQRGATNPNVVLLQDFLNKPLVKDIAWTFAHPSMHSTGPFGATDFKLKPGFEKKLISQAKAGGFPKKVRRQLKKVLLGK